MTDKELTRGERVIAFIENYCVVPEGKLVGQPVVLADFQRKFILEVYDNPHVTDTAILSIARKNAKALCLDTPIPTPDGWKTMRDIKQGDYVYGSSGKPVKVTAESGVFTEKECFELLFSDGSKVVASEDHIWTTKHKYRPWDDGEKPKYNRRPVVANVTTRQIVDSLLIKRADGNIERNHSVPVAPAIQGSYKKVSIDPYVLGAWLGDGSVGKAEFTFSNDDLNHLVDCLSKTEKGVSVRLSKNRAATVFVSDKTLSWKDSRRIGFRQRMRDIGVFENKHIPELYFNLDIDSRWLLLQGLMDTDGTVNRCGGSSPRASFCNKNKTLAYDVWRLCRSLGLKAKILKYKSKFYEKDCGDCYKVEFAASNNHPIFSLDRKQKLLSDRIGKRSKTIQIVSAKSLGKKPCKCIAVESDDRLFLAGHGCIPTHNTGTIAFLVLAHLVGTEAVQNSRIVSGARSREQAAEVYNLASKCVQLSPKLGDIIKIVPSSKKLIGLPMNVEYQAISAEGKTAHGKSPILAILDEVGQVVGAQDDFIDAITTAQGAYDNPLLIYISTQAASDSDFLSIAIDDAETNKPDKLVCHVYSADEDADLLDEKAWKDANPALGLFRSEADMRKQAEKAARMPSFENTFRNLNLNQRVSTNSPFISRDSWKKCEGAPVPIEECTEIYGGLDLSGKTDLTAFVLYGFAEDTWNVYPYFWTPAEGIHDRAKRDRAPYDVWNKQGFLRTTPGATVDYEFVAQELYEILETINIDFIAYDRWRIDILQKELDRAGLELPLIEWGQGFKDMSPALDALEGKILNGTLRHGNNPVLNMCASNAMVMMNPAGDRKLDKMKTSGRIDGTVALAMAAGIAERNHERFGNLDDFINAPLIT